MPEKQNDILYKLDKNKSQDVDIKELQKALDWWFFDNEENIKLLSDHLNSNEAEYFNQLVDGTITYTLNNLFHNKIFTGDIVGVEDLSKDELIVFQFYMKFAGNKEINEDLIKISKQEFDKWKRFGGFSYEALHDLKNIDFSKIVIWDKWDNITKSIITNLNQNVLNRKVDVLNALEREIRPWTIWHELLKAADQNNGSEYNNTIKRIEQLKSLGMLNFTPVQYKKYEDNLKVNIEYYNKAIADIEDKRSEVMAKQQVKWENYLAYKLKLEQCDRDIINRWLQSLQDMELSYVKAMINYKNSLNGLDLDFNDFQESKNKTYGPFTWVVVDFDYGLDPERAIIDDFGEIFVNSIKTLTRDMSNNPEKAVGTVTGMITWWLAAGYVNLQSWWQAWMLTGVAYAAGNRSWNATARWAWRLAAWGDLKEVSQSFQKWLGIIDEKGDIVDGKTFTIDALGDIASGALTFGIANKIMPEVKIFTKFMKNNISKTVDKTFAFGMEELIVENFVAETPVNFVKDVAKWVTDKKDIIASFDQAAANLKHSFSKQWIADNIVNTFAYGGMMMWTQAWFSRLWWFTKDVANNMSTLYTEVVKSYGDLQYFLDKHLLTIGTIAGWYQLVDAASGAPIDLSPQNQQEVTTLLGNARTSMSNYISGASEVLTQTDTKIEHNQQVHTNVDISQVNQNIKHEDVSAIADDLNKAQYQIETKRISLDKLLEKSPDSLEQAEQVLDEISITILNSNKPYQLLSKFEIWYQNLKNELKTASFIKDKIFKIPILRDIVTRIQIDYSNDTMTDNIDLIQFTSWLTLEKKKITKVWADKYTSFLSKYWIKKWDTIIELHIMPWADFKQLRIDLTNYIKDHWKDSKLVFWISHLVMLWKRFWFDIIYNENIQLNSAAKKDIFDTWDTVAKQFSDKIWLSSTNIKKQIKQSSDLQNQFIAYLEQNIIWWLTFDDKKYLEMRFKYDAKDIWIMMQSTDLLLERLSINNDKSKSDINTKEIINNTDNNYFKNKTSRFWLTEKQARENSATMDRVITEITPENQTQKLQELRETITTLYEQKTGQKLELTDQQLLSLIDAHEQDGVLWELTTWQLRVKTKLLAETITDPEVRRFLLEAGFSGKEWNIVEWFEDTRYGQKLQEIHPNFDFEKINWLQINWWGWENKLLTLFSKYPNFDLKKYSAQLEKTDSYIELFQSCVDKDVNIDIILNKIDIHEIRIDALSQFIQSERFNINLLDNIIKYDIFKDFFTSDYFTEKDIVHRVIDIHNLYENRWYNIFNKSEQNRSKEYNFHEDFNRCIKSLHESWNLDLLFNYIWMTSILKDQWLLNNTTNSKIFNIIKILSEDIPIEKVQYILSKIPNSNLYFKNTDDIDNILKQTIINLEKFEEMNLNDLFRQPRDENVRWSKEPSWAEVIFNITKKWIIQTETLEDLLLSLSNIIKNHQDLNNRDRTTILENIINIWSETTSQFLEKGIISLNNIDHIMKHYNIKDYNILLNKLKWNNTYHIESMISIYPELSLEFISQFTNNILISDFTDFLEKYKSITEGHGINIESFNSFNEYYDYIFDQYIRPEVKPHIDQINIDRAKSYIESKNNKIYSLSLEDYNNLFMKVDWKKWKSELMQWYIWDCYLIAELIWFRDKNYFEHLVRQSIKPTVWWYKVTLPLGDIWGKEFIVSEDEINNPVTYNWEVAQRTNTRNRDNEDSFENQYKKWFTILEIAYSKLKWEWNINIKNMTWWISRKAAMEIFGDEYIKDSWEIKHARDSTSIEKIVDKLINFKSWLSILSVWRWLWEDIMYQSNSWKNEKLHAQHAYVITNVQYKNNNLDITITNPHDSQHKNYNFTLNEMLKVFNWFWYVELDIDKL